MKSNEIFERNYTDNENRLFPFLCVYGDEDEQTLVDAVAHVYDSGARGLTVESKRSPHFCKAHWWFTLDTVLRECKKRGMKMWIQDEKFAPSGYANGAVKKHPELRKKHLVETHADVIGPMCGAKFLSCPTADGDVLVGVAAYRRKDGETEDLSGTPIDLMPNLHGDTVYWDVPDGTYRIFFLYVTQAYSNDYIDFFNRDSVQLVLDEIYEPHYKRYQSEFGKTFAGFFSDEPGFWNPPFGEHKGNPDDFSNGVGVKGYAMPWGENVRALAEKERGAHDIGDFVALWYNTEKSGQVRYAYMNAVTSLFYEVFNKTLGDWCKARGVVYNGHIVEDNGVHARLGMGAGHYFRAMQVYDVSGVDIVLHQVLPGFGHCRHAAYADGGFTDTDFYHYVLGQLAASDAHVNKKSGKALCEIFGAFGWGEDVSMMKWLIDCMLVRGVTRFIPHSFTTHAHDPVFPPTFSAKNNDPQFGGLKKLFGYVQKAGALIESGTHAASVALLYSGFAEWMCGDGKALETTARELYDAHICYDIISEDTVLHAAEVSGEKLVCGRESYGVLVVPPVSELPAALGEKITLLANAGLQVLFVNGMPQEVSGETVALGDLVAYLRQSGNMDVSIVGNEYLRYYHCINGNRHVYMFFNESVTESAETVVRLRHGGRYLRANLLSGAVVRADSYGEIKIRLAPYESAIYVFDNFPNEEFFRYEKECTDDVRIFPECTFDISVAPFDGISRFTPYEKTKELFDIAAYDRLPHFSGAVRYETTFHADEDVKPHTLDLGAVGGVACVRLNGADCGTAICSPYTFDIADAVQKGANRLEITVYTPLAGAVIREDFGGFAKRLTAQIPLRFCGLAGPISLVGHCSDQGETK